MLASLALAQPTPLVRDRAVDAAMVRASRWLIAQQQPDGAWPDTNDRYLQGGTTALAAWAICTADPGPDHPAVAKAMAYLGSLSPDRTPARALRALCAAAAGEQAQRQLDADVRWLVSTQRDDGGWARQDGGEPSTTFDTAVAVLALAEARRAGVALSADVPDRAAAFLKQTMNPDGGWGHYPPNARPVRVRGMSHGSATAATAAACRSLLRMDVREAIAPYEASQAWLQKAWAVDHIPGWGWGQAPRFAYRYFLSQTVQPFPPATAGARSYDEQLAAWLLARQADEGHYVGQPLAESDVVATAWALLTLADVRKPLLLQRLHLGPNAVASQPAVDRAVAWIAGKLRRDDAWRELSVNVSGEQLRHAPLLLITGRGPFDLPAETARGVTEFVDLGGMVAVVPDGPDPVFQRTADEFLRALLPRCQTRPVPPDHPLFNRVFNVQNTEAASIGDQGRKHVFLLPATMLQQLRAADGATSTDAYALLGNIAALAAEAGLENRKFDPMLQPAPDVAPPHVVTLARLVHAGDWQAGPHATSALSRTLSAAISVGVKGVNAKADQDIPAQAALLWLTGSTFEGLLPAHREKIRAYLDAGGLLLIDSAYGGEAFYAQALRELALLYGPDAVRPVPLDHPLLTGEFAGDLGNDITMVSFSEAARKKVGRSKGRPPLVGIERDGRLVAVASPLGLAAPVAGDPPYDYVGYVPDDARRVMLNVLLYAMASREAGLAGGR